MSESPEYCATCREVYAQEGKHPPCSGCEFERPALMDENQEAWALWRHIQTQVRTSFAGVVGVDYVAARQVAEVLGVDLDLAMLHKVQTLEGVMLQEVNAENGK